MESPSDVATSVQMTPKDDPCAHTAVALYADLLDAEGRGEEAVRVRQLLAQVDAPCAPMQLNPGRVDYSLRQVIAEADYDLHKGLEGDETDVDGYPELVQKFIESYRA